MATPSRNTAFASAPDRAPAFIAPANKNSQSSAGAGAPARTYEIRRQTGGRWFLDSVADEKDVAIAMAKRLLLSSRPHSEVQVASVQTKPDGEFSEVTIFRAKPGAQPSPAANPGKFARPAGKATAAAQQATVQQRLAPARPNRDVATTVDAMREGFFSISGKTWLAIALVAAWCAVFYLWARPQTPWAFDAPAAQKTVKQPIPLP